MIDPLRYRALYDVLKPVADRAPVVRLDAGTIIFRSVAASYKGVAPTPTSACTIRNGSTADFRWSGARPIGPGRGALYVSMHLDAMSNELFHYADKDPSIAKHPLLGRPLSQDALAATRTFRFEITATQWVADISFSSSSGRAFLLALEHDRTVRAALTSTGYVSIRHACDANDYSFPRALGHAILDTHPILDGLRVTTARDEWAKIGETGDNLALFGPDNAPLPYLKPLSETLYAVDAKGKLVQTVRKFP